MVLKIPAIVGRRAETVLLENAELIFSKGSKRIYTKYGTNEDALQDFMSMKPAGLYDMGSQKWGVVGDRMIVYQNGMGTGDPSLTLFKYKTKNKKDKTKTKEIMRTFVYKTTHVD